MQSESSKMATILDEEKKKIICKHNIPIRIASALHINGYHRKTDHVARLRPKSGCCDTPHKNGYSYQHKLLKVPLAIRKDDAFGYVCTDVSYKRLVWHDLHYISTKNLIKHAREVAHSLLQFFLRNFMQCFVIAWGTACSHVVCFPFREPGHRKKTRLFFFLKGR